MPIDKQLRVGAPPSAQHAMEIILEHDRFFESAETARRTVSGARQAWADTPVEYRRPEQLREQRSRKRAEGRKYRSGRRPEPRT